MTASYNLSAYGHTPDDLHSGDIRTVPVTVNAGTYVRGEVLGLSGNNYLKLASGAAAAAVMPEGITLAAATVIPVYVGGEFNEDALNTNGQPLADVKTALRKLGIYARKWGAAPNVL